MKMIVAIDWMTEFRNDFTFVKIESTRLKDAQLEAIAKVAKVSAEMMEIRKMHGRHPMGNVYCMKLLEVKSRGTEAVDVGWRFSGYSCSWSFEETAVGKKWSFVDPRCAQEVK